MPTLSFSEARACVIDTVRRACRVPATEEVHIEDASGRVLAEDLAADRDYPPVARSIRDGFALRSADVPGELRIAGEVRAGERYDGAVAPGEAVEIMTGAPVPRGADAVVMVEHCTRDGSSVRIDGAVKPGQYINPQGSEARAGTVLLASGTRLDYSAVALAAAVGCATLRACARPEVAIVATGDEIVEVGSAPREYEIRNSNAYSLAAQVRRAGGTPRILPVAKDEEAHTRALVERGLESDLLLLSGGVSAGKYDIVERVLAGLAAEFFFDRVLIQPGQPLVFGRARKKFFFGLPGNPASTMVTFEIFARAALDLLGGCRDTELPTPLARLTADFRHKTGLTRFLPARLSAGGAEVTPVPWQGSSDMAAMARANAYLVADAGRDAWSAGELIPVLLK